MGDGRRVSADDQRQLKIVQRSKDIETGVRLFFTLYGRRRAREFGCSCVAYVHVDRDKANRHGIDESSVKRILIVVHDH